MINILVIKKSVKEIKIYDSRNNRYELKLRNNPNGL